MELTNKNTNILLVDETGAGLPELKRIAELFSAGVLYQTLGLQSAGLPARENPALIIFRAPEFGNSQAALIKSLRENLQDVNTPVLLLSGLPPGARFFEKISPGYADYLNWPAEPEILEGKIRFYIDFYRQKQLIKEFAGRPNAAFLPHPAYEIQPQEEVHLNQMKNEFLTNISHELRTPLNVIIGMTHLVLMDELSPLQKDRINDIKLSGEFLLHIIDEILNLSKIDTNILELDLSEFNLANLVTNISRIVSPKAVKKKLKFIHHVPENLPEILVGDDVRISQVLFNLFDNAIKFTKSGEIRLLVDYEPVGNKQAKVSFKLSDTGVGIPANKLKTIFEPFKQADNALNRIFGGAGLGLAISQKLANKMGGNISVSSTPGEGSVFIFSLTLEIGGPERQNPSNKTLPQNVHILLVEDNAINSKLATAILQKKGWSVELAQNGVEAVEIYKDKPFDLIFMDVQMPVMDGFESTRLIREIEKKTGVHTPIITMTAHAYPGYDKVCFDCGMDNFITKPFKPERLYEMVESYLNKKSAKIIL